MVNPSQNSVTQTQATRAPVLIAAGGTGGHVYPALAVAEILRARNVPVIWLGTRAGLEARVVPEAGFDIEWVNVAGLRGKNLLQTVLGPFRLLQSMWQAWGVFSRRRPSAVLGMGGFVAGPGAAMALLRGRPLIIHEQNSVAGFTNRLVSRFARRVYTAFPNVFPANIKPVVIGNPVRAEIESLDAAATRLQHEGACRLLVVGGSRGARSLNQSMPSAVSHCSSKLEVWHQCGSADLANTRERYRLAGVSASVDAFIEPIVDAYRWADLIVCRAGAMTVSELAAAGLPSVLVPFPFAVDDHQRGNAMWLVNANAAVMLLDKDLNDENLSRAIDGIAGDRERLQQMASNAHSQHQPHAARTVADALLEVAA